MHHHHHTEGRALSWFVISVCLFKYEVTFVLVFSVGIGNGLSGPLKYLESLTVCIFIIYIFLVIEWVAQNCLWIKVSVRKSGIAEMFLLVCHFVCTYAYLKGRILGLQEHHSVCAHARACTHAHITGHVLPTVSAVEPFVRFSQKLM